VIDREANAPIFFIGMPRSGTTVLFDAFSVHPDLAWFSQHVDRFPRFPAIAVLSRVADLSDSTRRAISRSDQARPWLEKLRVGPSEAYNVWERCCGEKFRFSYLLGVEATSKERECVHKRVGQVLRLQGKARFSAKLTGPGRIGYLTSIFPDATFVHVIRDGRAVVQSLMRVPFWQEWRMSQPAWQGGLSDADLADWQGRDRSPIALAAIQWRKVTTSIRAESARVAADRYAEIHYERFVSEPHQTLDELMELLNLPHSSRPHQFLEGRFDLRNMNFQWAESLSRGDVRMLDELLSSTLSEFGYDRIDPGEYSDTNRVEQPFASADD